MKDCDLVIYFQFLTEPSQPEPRWDDTVDVNVLQNSQYGRTGSRGSSCPLTSEAQSGMQSL